MVEYLPGRYKTQEMCDKAAKRMLDQYIPDQYSTRVKGLMKKNHSVHWRINPSLKNTTYSFLLSPHLNLQTVQASPFFRQSSPLYWFFVNPTPLKVRFFSEPPKYYSFSSLSSSYLLKITKFLVKISQFEFLVMTEKNVFVYKLLSLNILDFSLFCM